MPPASSMLAELGRQAPFSFVSGWTAAPALNPCGFHNHPLAEIVHHPTGQGTTRVAGTPIAFSPGDTVIYAPLVEHDQTLESDGIDCCVQLRLPARLPPDLFTALLVRGPLPAWLTHELHELCKPQPSAGTLARQALDHRVTAVTLALLDRAENVMQQPTQTPGQRLAEQAASWISEHFQHIGRLEDVAAALGVSYDPLRRAFRRHRGMSLAHWLGEVRIARAKELLLHTPLGLDAIAHQCGYGGARYFGMVFREATSTPPGVWRQRMRRG